MGEEAVDMEILIPTTAVVEAEEAEAIAPIGGDNLIWNSTCGLLLNLFIIYFFESYPVERKNIYSIS